MKDYESKKKESKIVGFLPEIEGGKIVGGFLPEIIPRTVDNSKIEEIQMEGGALDNSKNNLVGASSSRLAVDTSENLNVNEKQENYCRLSLISGEKIKEAIESYNFMQDLLTSIKSERTFNKLTLA